MKLLLTIFSLCWGVLIYAQNVNIPDANFKNALLAHGYNILGYNINIIDTNGDGEIQVSEAQTYSGIINVNSRNITSLIGIEAFTSLTELHCYSNQLSSLDLGSNTALEKLYCSDNQLGNLSLVGNTALYLLDCSNNQLSNLELSHNTALVSLYCSNNLLDSLDLSNNLVLYTLICGNNLFSDLDLSSNTLLYILDCTNNQLGYLDVSNNAALAVFNCSNNQLSSLNVGNNIALGELRCNNNSLNSLDLSNNANLYWLICTDNQLVSLNVKNGTNSQLVVFDARNNPNLSCIEVDDSTYSTNHWTNVDAIASFSTACPVLSTRAVQENLEAVEVFPNPTTKNIWVDLGKKYNNIRLQLRNAMGQLVMTKNYTGMEEVNIDLEGASGLYFLSLETEEGIASIKVVKE
ncbi:T9SS type A sorting domain-containing protein [Aureispira anguillae]|uniref:T9SS type A sorting domain-containing protein n=1 Tax=Aureispira anguillae TaxID=2864201 RepID=A0A916DVF4_9BACT|nr:T9SS type A sorting domain-containing protein [Aureispira anguillae]BDS14301.1 T9SS type A sorting domain-containing protein [Aureispira anguillae]